jgi:ATP-binding cassette subfamily C (CFTR/MRP) protein 1
MPLTMFPIVLSTTATAMVAMTRISEFLNAEEMPTSYQLDTGSSHAVHVDADFAWEEVAKTATTDEKDKGNDAKKKKSRKKSKSSALPVVADQTDAPDKTETEKPFALNDFKMTVAKGAFVAVRLAVFQPQQSHLLLVY